MLKTERHRIVIPELVLLRARVARLVRLFGKRDGGFEGAKFMCSPAPRDTAEHARIWEMIRRGTLDVVSSDHCGFSFEGARGKAAKGRDASFEKIPNGIPGFAARVVGGEDGMLQVSAQDPQD
jgi:hypothetical protein